MKRYNGWGDDAVRAELSSAAEKILEDLAGPARPGKTVSLEVLLGKVPDSRIPEAYPGISVDARERLSHTHGQSLPDWIAMRYGTTKHFPDAVAVPTSEEEAEDVLGFADKHQMTVIPCGGGTSVAGHLDAAPDNSGSARPVLSLSTAKMNRLERFSPETMLATFGAGIAGPALESALNSHGYTLGHYPQSFEYSTLGGWVTTRSSGQQSIYYGRIEDLFAGGRVLTPQGRMTFPPYPASAAGPDLRHILLGSEGRMGLLTKATVRISKIPEIDHFYGYFFPEWESAAAAARDLANADLPLSMIRLSNPMETYTNLFLAGREKKIGVLKRYLRLRGIKENTQCMMLVGFAGLSGLYPAGKRLAETIIRKKGGISTGRAMGNAWRKNRFRAPYLRNTLWERGYAVDTLETATTWDSVTSVMNAVENAVSRALDPEGEKIHVFSHLSHVYSTGSSIYTTYVFRLADSPEETLQRWKRIKKAASREIVRAGATISHQHGVGTDHKPYLSAEKGEGGIAVLQSIFDRVDPESRMNPGKLVDRGTGHGRW